MLGTGTTSDVVVDNGYAVKHYRDRRPGESRKQFRVRAELEFQLLQSLNHPHIVAVSKFTTTWLGDSPKMYMELGVPNWWTNHPKKHQAMSEIVMAVVYLHAHGVAHRDLKLDNTIMVDGVVKLVDFAVATRQPQAVGLVGLAAYVAPEQFTQITYCGVASDVWLVAMIYLYLNGMGPWWHQAHRLDVGYQAYVGAGALPAPVPAWVAQALTIDPTQRPLMATIALAFNPPTTAVTTLN